jgi:hypothetical protein
MALLFCWFDFCVFITTAFLFFVFAFCLFLSARANLEVTLPASFGGAQYHLFLAAMPFMNNRYFSAARTDELIWGEKIPGNAIYLHRPGAR